MAAPAAVGDVRDLADLVARRASAAGTVDGADPADMGELADLVVRRAPAAGTAHLRTRALCVARGVDPTSVPTIHVTGTRGKTSTAWMVDALLREVGLVTMRFTSPHLHCPGERLVVDGVASSTSDMGDRWRRLRPTVESLDRAGQPPGFFDVVTTMFVERACEVRPDVAIVEVGRGGRDDATNVFAADVAVFTPIGGDHPDLGATPVALARTKFGIATHGGRRPTGPRFVSARQAPDVARLLASNTAARGWPLRVVGGHGPVDAGRNGSVAVGRHRVGALNGSGEPAPRPGSVHQADNAALAVAAVEAFLGSSLDPLTVRRALHDLVVPGRLEARAVGDVAVWFDGAHDPVAAAALARSLPAMAGRRVFVVGAGRDKDLVGMLAALATGGDEVVATTLPSPASASAGQVASAAATVGLPVRTVPDPDAALDMAVAAASSSAADDVVVTGSLHLVGHLRRRTRAIDEVHAAVEVPARTGRPPGAGLMASVR